MKKTKIVATIGPASDSKEILRELFLSGLNVCRLNFSHGTHESHRRTIHLIKELREEMDLPIGIMLDTKGPEIRLGRMKDDLEYLLHAGDIYAFVSRELEGDGNKVTISYGDLWKDIEVGQKLLVDDGLLEMEVISIEPGVITAKALNTGIIKSNKGVNLPGAYIRQPSLTDKDIDDIALGIEEDVDFIAASFIRSAEDILAIRKVLEQKRCTNIKIIAKIENQEGVENIDEIVNVSDGIMVARGDLGVEIEAETIPLVQKELIKKSVDEGIPVITATQMLDSMIRNPRPTRAETTDVANAIFDGTSAIMLSGETASGRYPIEAVKTMARIAEITEAALDYQSILNQYTQGIKTTTTNVIARSAVEMSMELDASAIVVATTTGYSARAISKFRPQHPIVAVTPDEKVLRQMSLDWGIIPLKSKDKIVDVFKETIPTAQEAGVIHEGDLVILVAGIPQGIAGSTNLLKVHQVAQAKIKGKGIGKEVVIGQAFVVNGSRNYARDFKPGDILITQSYGPELASLLDRAGGLITEEDGLTSEGAIAGLYSGIPTIIGAKDAVNILPDRSFITMDATTGEIYLGRVDAK